MKTLIIILAVVLSATGTLFANVTVRTDGGPVVQGSVVHLSWQRPSPTLKSAVDVSYDLGSTWTEIATKLEQDSMDWTIPAVKFETLQFRVRLDKPVPSTYEIPTSYRRPGSTTAKAWSPNGDTLITIEGTDSTCHVLRTDLVNDRTEKIWGVTNKSGWGRISRDLSCAFIALTGGGLIRVDLQRRTVVQSNYNVKMMEIVEKNSTVAIIDSFNELRCIDNHNLLPLRQWSLGSTAQTSHLFAVGERIVVVDTYWQSLIFTVDRPTGIWSPLSYRKFGDSDTLVISNNQFIDIRTHATIHELPFPINLNAISKNERYVVTSIGSMGNLSGFWFIDLWTKTQYQMSFDMLNFNRSFAFSDKDSCIFMCNIGKTYELAIRPGRIDTIATAAYTMTDFLQSGRFAFFSDVLQYTFTLDTIQHFAKDQHVSQVVPSPNPRFVVVRRSGRVELLDRQTGVETWLSELKDAQLTYKWSATGDSAVITDGRTIGILDVKTQDFQTIFKADTMQILNNVVSTTDMSRLFWVVDSRTVYAWNTSERTTKIVPWQGEFWVKELRIDERSDILSARFQYRWYSASKIMQSSIERLGAFSDFVFHTIGSLQPGDIQYHTYDTAEKVILVRETTSSSVLRLSAWSYNGELLWHRITQHPNSPTTGPLLMSGSGRFVIRTTTADHVYDTRTGTLVWTDSERVLGEVPEGGAYILLHSSKTLVNHAALDLSSYSRNERVSLVDSLQFKNTVVVSDHAIHFRSDSSWVVMINPSAVLAAELTLYSEVLNVGAVTHVALSQDDLQINTTGYGDGVRADIHMYDIQGRLLSTINGVDLSTGTTRVPTQFGPLPRYALIQVTKNGRLLYSGTVMQ